MEKWLHETTLEGTNVRLIPIRKEHEQALNEAAADGKLWQLWYTSVPVPENMRHFITKAQNDYEKDHSLPFAVIDSASGKIVGSTRFMNADSENKRLEIGTTWYAKSYQRTGLNTECKYLLLSYAFEKLNCIAVEFRTHWHNLSSRSAIERLGAKQDGVLRNHQIGPDGTFRDTVVFSIINSEWSTVKFSLQHKMNQYTLDHDSY